MNNEIAKYNQKKLDQSPFLTLKAGESIKVLKLVEVKTVLKTNVAGEEVEALRLVCDVDTMSGVMRKNFDNSSKKFADELMDKQIDVGAKFTLTREGEQTKTRYILSDVVNVKDLAAPAEEAQA